jgi:hypothetical protein
MDIKRLETLFSVVGSVILLVSWGVQQLLFDSWNSKLSKIGSAEAVFHAYRANDGLFRALRVIAPQAIADIELQQLKSYKNGLAVLTSVVDSNIYNSSRTLSIETLPEGQGFEKLNAYGKIMVEFDAMQRAITLERRQLSNRKEIAETVFLTLYVLGTLLLIASGAVKLIDVRRRRSRK